MTGNTGTKEVKLDENDIKYILGELYYTVSGTMKLIDCGRNKISDYIADGSLEVFRHPGGDLFSPASLEEWRLRHTLNGNGKMAKPKAKK